MLLAVSVPLENRESPSFSFDVGPKKRDTSLAVDEVAPDVDSEKRHIPGPRLDDADADLDKRDGKTFNVKRRGGFCDKKRGGCFDLHRKRDTANVQNKRSRLSSPNVKRRGGLWDKKRRDVN